MTNLLEVLRSGGCKIFINTGRGGIRRRGIRVDSVNQSIVIRLTCRQIERVKLYKTEIWIRNEQVVRSPRPQTTSTDDCIMTLQDGHCRFYTPHLLVPKKNSTKTHLCCSAYSSLYTLPQYVPDDKMEYSKDYRTLSTVTSRWRRRRRTSTPMLW